MSSRECAHELDVFDAISTGRWPARVDADLREHVATCAICTDVVTVAAAFESEPPAFPADHHLPESGAIWWKAQFRAREDARRAAGRPITVAQAVAFASCLGVAGALFGATSAWFQAWIVKLKMFIATIAMPSLPSISLPASMATTIAEHAVLVATIAAFLVLAPVTVFWVTRERP
jgi:hypothetical protein